MKLLTKSKYLIGLECPRHLWTIFNDPKKIPEASISDKFIMNQGIEVGKLATELFPDGINLPENYKENIKATEEAIKEKKILFEAGFEVNNLFSRADILVPVKSEYDLIEVKSGTEVKEENIQDVSFQKYCYELKGLKIRKCFLMHLNKEYVIKGELDLEKLFVKDDITSKVDEAIINIQERIDNLFSIINSKKCPVEKKCNPKECVLKDCYDLPKHHVFQLYRGGQKIVQLYEEGVYSLKDIPEDFKLTEKQEIQRECAVKNKPFVHKEKLKHFLKTLKYPLSFLDFETFSTAVPKFDGLKPYSQVCFQYSLHLIDKEGSEAKHFEFLYSGDSDPREEFIKKLKEDLKDSGSVIVYNESFEISRLKELALSFPSYKEWVEGVISRIVDLWVVFRGFIYYHPDQEGSASIKKVLPALTGKGYTDMDIAEGNTASVEFIRMAYGDCSEIERVKIRDGLLRYCCLDTLAEVMILEKLRGLI